MGNSRFENFVAHLQRRSHDRGFMADLKCGSSTTTEHRAYEHLIPWCKDLDDPRVRRILLTVSAGFSLRGKDSPNAGNLGNTLRKIAGKHPTFDARFRRVLSCEDVADACEHVLPILKAAAVKGIPVNFSLLYEDLTFWGEIVRVRWSRAYWDSSQEKGEH